MEDNHFYIKKLYTFKEVAELLNESEATIRFWMIKFKNILNIEFDGKHKKISDDNVLQLKKIKKFLREEGFSVAQLNKYYENNIMETSNESNDKSLVDEIVSKVSIALNTQLDTFKNDLVQYVSNEYNNLIVNQNKNNYDLKEIILTNMTQILDKKMLELEVFEKLKIEQEKNKQLTKIVLELNNSPTIEAKNKKRNLFDMF